MLVPLVRVRALHETDIPLAESPGEQALPAEVRGHRVVQPVQLPGRFRLLLDLKRFGSLYLHAESQLKRLNPCLQARVEPSHLGVPAIDIPQHVQFVAL